MLGLIVDVVLIESDTTVDDAITSAPHQEKRAESDLIVRRIGTNNGGNHHQQIAVHIRHGRQIKVHLYVGGMSRFLDHVLFAHLNAPEMGLACHGKRRHSEEKRQDDIATLFHIACLYKYGIT